MFSERAGTIEAQIEANRVAIIATRELVDSKINTLRFEVTTGLASLKELKAHDLAHMDQHAVLVAEEVKRRLDQLEKEIARLDATNRDYVLRAVYEKDEERLYSERRDSLAAREHGRRAMTMALISALVSVFNIAVSVILHYLK
ncbi:hypothetical protein [Paraburkholderia panacisoli]|uniref:hypothetical protein n=1 Tax=Paraburkholderia panacisoli TaxID=2603818 RepID=UPI001FE4FCCA|nr:hypothetical protein [Paraburkholderia panacisoli]